MHVQGLYDTAGVFAFKMLTMWSQCTWFEFSQGPLLLVFPSSTVQVSNQETNTPKYA